MPITGFNELVEELKLMREQFKEQQERQVAEELKRQQLETYIAELRNKPGKLPFLNELPTTAKFFEEVLWEQHD